MFRGEIKRQRRINRDKGGEKEREGEMEGYSNILGERERDRDRGSENGEIEIS